MKEQELTNVTAGEEVNAEVIELCMRLHEEITSQKNSSVIDLFANIFKGTIDEKPSVDDALKTISTEHEGVFVKYDKRYNISKKVVSALLNGASVGKLLDAYKFTINELIRLCDYSTAAKIEIARQGYGLNILAEDYNDALLFLIVKQGYWKEEMRESSSDVRLEAISRGIDLYYFATDRLQSFKVRIAAICKLIELHSHNIYEGAIIAHYCVDKKFKDIVGNHYTLKKDECLKIMKEAIHLKDALPLALEDFGIINLI